MPCAWCVAFSHSLSPEPATWLFKAPLSVCVLPDSASGFWLLAPGSWILSLLPLRGGRSTVSSTPAGFKMFHFPLKWQAASQKFMHVHLLLTLPRLHLLLATAPCFTHTHPHTHILSYCCNHRFQAEQFTSTAVGF